MRALGIAQQGLWHGYVLNEDRAMFNTAECIAFAGKIQPALLIAALRQAVNECEALAGHFVVDGEQVWFNPAELPLSVAQLQVPAGVDAQAWVQQWGMADIRQPFDLECELPCRFTLLQGEQVDFLYGCIHHIALDGYASNLLYQPGTAGGAGSKSTAVPRRAVSRPRPASLAITPPCWPRMPSAIARAVRLPRATTGVNSSVRCPKRSVSASASRPFRRPLSVIRRRFRRRCGRA